MEEETHTIASLLENLFSKGNQILLFDGVCNLCNGFVQFVITRDTKQQFKYASLQSEIGQQILEHYALPKTLDTTVLVTKHGVYIQSDVALKIGQALGGWMSISVIGWLIPKFVRNKIYNFIAENRYRFFGKQDQCFLPKPEWKNRFLNNRFLIS